MHVAHVCSNVCRELSDPMEPASLVSALVFTRLALSTSKWGCCACTHYFLPLMCAGSSPDPTKEISASSVLAECARPMLKAAAVGGPGASSLPEPGRRGVCGGSNTCTLCSFSFPSTNFKFSAAQHDRTSQLRYPSLYQSRVLCACRCRKCGIPQDMSGAHWNNSIRHAGRTVSILVFNLLLLTKPSNDSTKNMSATRALTLAGGSAACCHKVIRGPTCRQKCTSEIQQAQLRAITYHCAVRLQCEGALIAISGLEPVLIDVLVPVTQPGASIRLKDSITVSHAQLDIKFTIFSYGICPEGHPVKLMEQGCSRHTALLGEASLNTCRGDTCMYSTQAQCKGCLPCPGCSTQAPAIMCLWAWHLYCTST